MELGLKLIQTLKKKKKKVDLNLAVVGSYFRPLFRNAI